VVYTLGMVTLPGQGAQSTALVDFTGSVTAPAIHHHTTSVTLTQPVTLSGFFEVGFGPVDTLVGEGTATLVLDVIPGPLGPLWQYQSVTPPAEDPPLAPPEPASLWLLATGIGLIGWRRVRR